MEKARQLKAARGLLQHQIVLPEAVRRLSREFDLSERQDTPSGSREQVRATISFPPVVYETLEGIAKEKKVLLTWVVREAAEKYIADKWPLLATTQG